PVWEANHVWLIFSFVVLWTCFPEADASIGLTLFVPLTLAALGIVLRGASFAFRKAVFRTRDQRNFGAAFAVSSVLVPYCLGAVLGAIASGRVPSGGRAGDPWDSWVNPTSIMTGVLAVCVAAYLAAVFLVRDAHRLSDDAMVAYFRVRATAAAVVAGVTASVGLFVLHDDAPYIFDGITSRSLPLAILSAIGGVASLWLLRKRSTRGMRLAAVAAVGFLLLAWAVAQWDYILPQTLTVHAAAAPTGTITAVVVATGLAVLMIVPAFVLLYVLDQKDLLPEESVETGSHPSVNDRSDPIRGALTTMNDSIETSARVLLVYYTHTRQAQRVSQTMAEVLAGRGCDVSQAAIEFTDPHYSKNFARFPFRHAVFSILPLLWPQLRHKTGQIRRPEAAKAGEYDLICLGSPTWFFMTAMPMRSYLKSEEARRLLAGTPFAAYVVCRRYWSVNLNEVKRLGTADGGRFVDGIRFAYEGGQVRSLLALLSYFGTGEMRERRLGIKIPPTNLKPDFGSQAQAFANQLADTLTLAGRLAVVPPPPRSK
ncbi:MAG: cytochrome d ubiquinol oxidase subunit II, partial [Gaiellales bacterium]